MLFLRSKFTITYSKSLELQGQYLKKDKAIPSQSVHRVQFLVDCRRLSSLPHISFVIGHHEYKLTAEQYIIKVCIHSFPAPCSLSWGGSRLLQGHVLSLPGVYWWPNLLHERLSVSRHPHSHWLALDFRRCLHVCVLLHFWPWEWQSGICKSCSQEGLLLSRNSIYSVFTQM